MSQLSFADVFNMAREAADNSPVIQAGQQIAEMVPTVQRMMSEQYSRSRFIRVFKEALLQIVGGDKLIIPFC